MNPDDASVAADAPTVPPPIGSDASPPPPPPPPPMTNAVLINDCAPNDAPAYTLRISPDPLVCMLTPPGTFDEITVWKNVPAGFGIVDVTPGMNGDARVCTNGTCTPALSAQIMFSVIISTEVRGTYVIKTMDGARTGKFDGVRCNNPAMCG
jgi:hypothetical protein